MSLVATKCPTERNDRIAADMAHIGTAGVETRNLAGIDIEPSTESRARR